eukprot:GHUV01007332.1.p1 GENE.GHUV01007332.1~~GHUV01007332.1.p1  ORF type:complete len:433 (+),score=148.76 GHUV01007332.1:403-1701(+)
MRRPRQPLATGHAHFGQQLPSHLRRTNTVHRAALACVARASKKQPLPGGNSGSSSIPPPPPTVAPPLAAPRQPKVKQAYRSRKKTDEERQQEQAARKQRFTGRTKYLKAEDLARKHAALASAQRSAGHFPTVIAKPAKRHAAHPVVLIDGYNLLYYHGSTRLLMEQDKVEVARSYLHVILKQYAAEHSRSEYYVIYDATSVPQSKPDCEFRIADRVTAVYKAGQEADSVIMHTIQQQHEAAYRAAQAGAGPASSQQRTYIVYTNDKRIHEWCNHLNTDAAKVFCYGQRDLSQQLKRVENRLDLAPGSDAAAAAAAAAVAVATSAAAGYSRPSLDQDSHSWAKQLLIKHRLQQQQLQWQQQQQELAQQQEQQQQPHSGFSDAELLERARADTLAAAGSAAADAPANAAPASTTEHLDDLLNMNLESLLLDTLE